VAGLPVRGFRESDRLYMAPVAGIWRIEPVGRRLEVLKPLDSTGTRLPSRLRPFPMRSSMISCELLGLIVALSLPGS